VTNAERARLWLRWTLRDARQRWLQVCSIGLLLALGVGMYSAMSSMSVWRTASADASFAALHSHDLRVSLTPGSAVPEGTLRRALAALPDARVITAAQERLVVSTQVKVRSGQTTVIVPGRIVGSPPNSAVDATASVQGRSLPADSRARVVLLERNFAKHYSLPPAGTLSLSGGRQVRYVGQALASEYFIVTAPGADFGAEANFAVVFASLTTAQALSGESGRVNEVVLRVSSPAALDRVETEVGAALRRALPQTGFTLTRGDQEAARRMLYKDAEGDQQMMDVFAALLLGAAALAALNLVSRAVEAQRREIGIGMALGVAPRVLALRPLLIGTQVALIGIALGVPAGFAANAWLRSVMQSFFPLPVVKTPMQLGVFIQAAALGLAVSLIATVLPLRRALRVTPVEAIRVGARAAKSSGLAWLTKGLRLPGGSLSNLPVRNVLRAPRRTLMTALGISAVVAITLALSGVIDSFNVTLATSRVEALAGAPQRLIVDLAAPQPADGQVVRAIAGSPVIAGEQPALRLPVTLAGTGGQHLDAFLELVAARGELWHPTLRQGSFDSGTPGITISQRAADDLRVGVGGVLSVRYPAPAGPSGYRLVTAKLPVTGIHTSPLRFLVYGSAGTTTRLRLAGLVNRVSVVPAAGRTAADVKQAFLAMPSVTAVQGAAAMNDAVNETMSQFTSVLIVTVAIAIVMALLIAYNAAAINAEERVREHATMFAYGVGARRVLRGNVIEALIVGALATAVGIAGGYGILRWMTDASMRETMPDLGTLVSISLTTYVLAALAGIVAVALAPLLTVRRLRRIDIPSALRVVE
jgi:putative ABC transport system permease protein